MAKISTLFPDWWRLSNYGKGWLFACLENEVGLKDSQRNTQYAALNVQKSISKNLIATYIKSKDIFGWVFDYNLLLENFHNIIKFLLYKW